MDPSLPAGDCRFVYEKTRLNRTFGKNLREHRESLGYSQEGYALFIDLDRAHYARLERADKNISLSKISALSERLGVSPYWLLRDRDDVPE